VNGDVAPDAERGPVDPKAGRFDRVVTVLRVATLLVLVLAAVALVVGGEVGRSAAWVALAVLCAVPLLRVAWLAVRWFRRGDPRYGLVACGVLAVVAVGLTLA